MLLTPSRLSLGVLVLAFVASGCGLFGGGKAPDVPEVPETPETPIGPTSVSLTGLDDMNAGGNAARVYLYPLVSDATFLATPVQAFWDDPEGTLADDLVGAVRDATVRPGQTTSLEDLTLEGATFLGVAADLREPESGEWRAVLPASQVRGKALRITVAEGGLSVRAR